VLSATVGLIIVGLSGCSDVPGDAVLRAGHPEAAAGLYQRGAEQGNGAAAFRLGLLVGEGQVSAAKFGTAAEWYVKACDRGVLPGCHNTGVYYEEGENGVTKDYGVARTYHLKAAEIGYMQSQYNLASMYSTRIPQLKLQCRLSKV
jgi:TPR repeat protein